MKRILGLIGAGGLTLLAVGSAHADIIFATNPNGFWAVAGVPLVVGTPFTVGASPVSITSLGFVDQSGSGLLTAHEVRIYSFSQALLAGVVVPSGATADAYHDGTRWMALSTPIALAPNASYMLAATVTPLGDKVNLARLGQVTINPYLALSGTGYVFQFPGSLAYPTIEVGTGEYIFGGNMVLTAVPEPSQWAAMGITLLGLAGYGFRRYRLNQAP